MVDLLLPADAEQAVIDELAGWQSVATKIPDSPPNSFLRVVSAGGGDRSLVSDQHLLVLEGFGRKETDALGLLSEAVGRLHQAVTLRHQVGGVPAYAFGLGSLPQNLPLATLPGYARYLATIAVDLRRRTL